MRKSDSAAWKIGLLVAVVVSVAAIGAMSMMRAPDDPIAERAEAKQKQQEKSTTPSSPSEPSDLREIMDRFNQATQIAQITEVNDCEWAKERQFAEGHALGRGDEVDLIKGRAKIKFNSGAHVILEGPAKFKLISTTSAELKAGRMTADVPDDVQDFTIDTPVARIVDADFVRSDKRQSKPDSDKPIRLGKGESKRIGAGESIRID